MGEWWEGKLYRNLTVKSVNHIVVLMVIQSPLLLLLQKVGTSGPGHTTTLVVVVAQANVRLLSDSHSCDDFSVGIVGIERQRISPTHLEGDGLPGSNRLEHVHHVVVGVTQDALVHHVHDHVTCLAKGEKRKVKKLQIVFSLFLFN